MLFFWEGDLPTAIIRDCSANPKVLFLKLYNEIPRNFKDYLQKLSDIAYLLASKSQGFFIRYLFPKGVVMNSKANTASIKQYHTYGTI